MPRRRKDKVDINQPEIVKSLRALGYSVELDHDDILVGKHGRTYWYEIKSEDAVSKKTGKVLQSAKKDHQIKLEATYQGHYKIVSSLDEILEDLNLQ